MKSLDLDEFQSEIGGISRYQILVILAASMVPLMQPMTSQSAIFMHGLPKHRCADPILDNLTVSCNITHEVLENLTQHNEGDFSCSRLEYNLTNCAQSGCDVLHCLANKQDATTTSCNRGYIYSKDVFGETVATKFGLVCGRRYLDTISQTLFYFGFFLGSAIVGPISDWYGRKTATLIMTSGLIVTSCATALSPSYEVYTVLRVLVGAFNIATFIAVNTYTLEIADTTRRTEVGSWTNMVSGISHTIYPLIALGLRDWRPIQLALGLLVIPSLSIFTFLPESPRWLLANGKTKKAKKIVGNFAASKRKILDDQTWKLIVQTENKKRSECVKKHLKSEAKIRLFDLFYRPCMRILCFIVMISWFTVSLVYYGLTLNGGNLAGDPYVNTLLNGFVEILAILIVYLSLFTGRRLVLAVSFVSAGVCCLCSMVSQQYAFGRKALFITSTVFAITGKFFGMICFSTLYIVTSEVFPTQARTTGLSLGSMSARVGGMLAPLMVEIQRKISWLAPTIFGIFSIITGILTLFYPETLKIDLLSTMDEAEKYYKEKMAITNCLKRQKKNKSYKKNKPETEVMFMNKVA